MKIIIVPNEPNPNMTGRHYGIAKSLAAAGHEVHTVVWELPQLQHGTRLIGHLFTAWQRREYDYEDIRLHKIRRLPYFWPVVNGWLFGRQLRKLYHSLQADIIITESYTNETAVPKDLPFIYDLADDYAAPADVFGSVAYKVMFSLLGVRRTMRKQCRRALAVTAVSDILCDYAQPYNANVIKLPNGVETDLIRRSLKQSSKTNINPHSLIYVSGFGPWSRPLDLIRQVTKLRKEFPKIELSLVGEGSEVGAIKQYIADNDAASYIHYHGFIHDRETVFDLIASHAIGLNISDKNKWRDAAHPMKVIEYSALGKKVVSTDLEGVKALGFPNIFLFSNTDREQNLQKALRQALTSTANYATYESVSEGVLREYDWSKLAAQLVGVITEVNRVNQTLKVTHVTPAYPPNLGGLEKVVESLAKTQKTLGYDVKVVTSNQGSGTVRQPEAFPVSRLNSFLFANTTIMPTLLFRLLRIRKNEIVHLHVTQAFTPEVVWLASRIKRFRYVVHVHLDVPASGWAGILLKPYKALLLRRVLKASHAVIVFTNDQKIATTRQYRLQPGKVVVIPNGVEDIFYFSKTRKLHTPPRLLFVGRLGYQKNLQQLLHALDGISDDFQTTLVGDGELREELIKTAKDLRLKHVIFAGRADGDKLLEFYRTADIFVLPSEREGMPLVLLEAMAMGLPIVATNVTGNRDVIQDKKNGLLVPYGDVTALRKALQTVGNDKARYDRMHDTALQMAAGYAWPKIAQRFDSLYRGLL